ncbi:MFS transporter [Actinoplanes sp. TBRC 11911]|uniref:MFS transporter n=1 Tax=Actinoplanes sp. TBRC 11911 TaxID=2729386 RepID=UPI00145F964B|nr:MFS transporter [Actinoplanes sp. TBRC 11911]NMO49787.1 MFS transporter [Actinoplanes sp. TBRC 11911]
MTTTAALTRRPALLSGALIRCFIAVIGSSVAFYLPLSVVPLFAEQSGSHGDAGLATVALLLACVACEMVTPRLMARLGYRWALAIGLTLLGLPTLVLTAGHSTTAILAVSVLRGAGFAISAVATNAIGAMLIPAERRAEGLALAGVMSGLPGLIALPAGVWVATHSGFTPVFVAATIAPLLALLAIPGPPRRHAAAAREEGVAAALTNPGLVRPALIFAASTAAVGVLVTFLPLAVTGSRTWVVAAALLVQPAAATATRWIAGRLGDRYGSVRLLTPGLILSGAGMAALALTGIPAAVLGGALLFGMGFGILQNATLALMYARAPRGGEGAVSAIWNAAYDLGMAAGALGAGLVVGAIGYPLAFLLTAAVLLPALTLARRER